MSNDVLPVGAIKGQPSDFVVQELVRSVGDGSLPVAIPSEFPFSPSQVNGQDGRHTVFVLQKRGVETSEALREVARQLGVRLDQISFHGIKDKNAVTAQLIAVEGPFNPRFEHPQIRLLQMWGQNERLPISAHCGNRFNILVRTSAEPDHEKVSRVQNGTQGILNLYGPQRTGKPGSEQLGRLLWEGDYNAAIDILLRDRFEKDFQTALKRGQDPVEALFDRRVFDLVFTLQKWQSWLWNKLAQELVHTGAAPEVLPFWSAQSDVRRMYQHLWNPESLEPKMTDLSHSHQRRLWIYPNHFYAQRVSEGWRFQFDLEPGAYATVVLSEFFALRDLRGNLPSRQ